MRGKKAKAIRKAVYGEQSLRNPRETEEINHKRVIDNDGRWLFSTATVVNKIGSLRSNYQRAKKMTLAQITDAMKARIA